MNIAFLGLGAMGLRVATQLLATGHAVKGAAAAMLARAFAPAFPIDLVAKDLGLVLGTGAHLPVTQAVGGAFQAAIAEGMAQDNITGIVQRYLRTGPTQTLPKL